MSRILLINPNKQHCSDIKFLLHLNGYQIESCDTIDEGINRYQIFNGLDRAFDLVLIVADNNLLSELETFEQNPFGNKLIIVHEKRTWKSSKRLVFSGFAICDPKLVLDCVKNHLKNGAAEVTIDSSPLNGSENLSKGAESL